MNLIGASPPCTARIVSVGDELLRNRNTNSNGSELSARLEEIGVSVSKIIAIGDEETQIIREIRDTQEDVLLLTGGLGPTQDDRTVVAMARACQVETVVDPGQLAYLEKQRRLRHLPERFLKQATVPQGFVVERSPYGSAPFLYRLGRLGESPRLIVLLPGVPFECLSLFERKVAPLIRKTFFSHHRVHRKQVQEIKIISVPESEVEERLEKIRQRSGGRSLEAAFLPSLGELLVRLRGEDATYLKKVAKELVAAFPEHQSYTAPVNRPIPSVVERIHTFLSLRKWRTGFAESCTGGLLTAGFVAFPGSSTYLDSGVVTYADQAKTAFCRVGPVTLKKFGAVSAETAREMVVGLAEARKLHLVVSITGIAGPGGGSREKPVGLVYIGLYHRPPGARTPQITVREFRFLKKSLAQENRNRIRERAVKHALFMMLEACFPKKCPA